MSQFETRLSKYVKELGLTEDVLPATIGAASTVTPGVTGQPGQPGVDVNSMIDQHPDVQQVLVQQTKLQQQLDMARKKAAIDLKAQLDKQAHSWSNPAGGGQVAPTPSAPMI